LFRDKYSRLRKNSFYFALTLAELLKSAPKSIFQVGRYGTCDFLQTHFAFLTLKIFILSACPDFDFTVEIYVAFANSDFRSVYVAVS
jgi:hypothetical protein